MCCKSAPDHKHAEVDESTPNVELEELLETHHNLQVEISDLANDLLETAQELTKDIPTIDSATESKGEDVDVEEDHEFSFDDLLDDPEDELIRRVTELYNELKDMDLDPRN